MRRHLAHPSRRRLREWLEHGDDAIDPHLSTCERCATRIEDLSEPQRPMADALIAVLAPPADLQPRLRSGIATKMQTREDLQLLVELLGIPVHTLRALSPPDDNLPQSSPSPPED